VCYGDAPSIPWIMTMTVGAAKAIACPAYWAPSLEIFIRPATVRLHCWAALLLLLAVQVNLTDLQTCCTGCAGSCLQHTLAPRCGWRGLKAVRLARPSQTSTGRWMAGLHRCSSIYMFTLLSPCVWLAVLARSNLCCWVAALLMTGNVLHQVNHAEVLCCTR
jgi:hypothetical protein